MSEKVTQPAVDAQPVGPVGLEPDAVKSMIENAVKSALADFQAKMEAEPAIKTAGYAVPAVHIARNGEKIGAEVAFKAYLHRQENADPAVKATLNETTDAQGGYAVPTQFAGEIMAPMADASILRAAGSRVLRLRGTDSFKLPSLTFSAAAVLKAESAAYAQSEPTLGEVEFNPYKYTKLSKATEELVADSRFDIWGQILQPDWTQAFAAAENAAFTTGSGSSQPQGVVTGSALGVTAASATAITADEIIDLVHSVSYLYRQRGRFMLHDTTLRELRKLKDGEGRYLWSVEGGLNGSPTGSLLGYPVITNNNMDEIATGKKTILFGDFGYYYIADWEGVGMQRLDELYAGTGEIGFRGYRRFDGNVMLSAAIKHLIQA
jgi:HK97 family phage major capsid protein